MAPPSLLRGRTTEEIVNRWSSDLDQQTREFARMAGEVAVWDRMLIENGEQVCSVINQKDVHYLTKSSLLQIASLHATVLAAETAQTTVNTSLDHMEQQQKELEGMLSDYEKTTANILEGPGNGSIRASDRGPADSERDKKCDLSISSKDTPLTTESPQSYHLAASLNSQLDDLSRTLVTMIDTVNTLTGSSNTDGETMPEDPMSQVAAILNAHLGSLQWIDGATREVESKVRDIEVRTGGAMTGARGVAGNVTPNRMDSPMSRSRGYGL
jgi:nuclear pore complex protein Nup62